MGLWIVRGPARTRKRPVWAENRLDGGAQFTITVRVMNQHARILLVDDEVAIQRAVSPLLRSRGYEVDVAGTGAQALEMFAARTPALIVLDLGLPDLEGTEVCRRIRAQSKVPIIVLSARGRRRGQRARSRR